MKPWFSKSAVKALSFYTLVGTIVAYVVGGLLAVWNVLDEPARGQVFMSIIIVASGVLLICLTNWAYLVAEEDRSRADYDADDTMRRALLKAKARREGEQESASSGS